MDCNNKFNRYKTKIKKNIMKKIIVSGLVIGLLAISGCGASETADLTRDFFQQVANDQLEDAYAMTSDVFQSYTDYNTFSESVYTYELDTYVDFEANGFESTIEDGVTLQTLTGDWSDSYGYTWPIEVYWAEEDGVWLMDGFYFLPDENNLDYSDVTIDSDVTTEDDVPADVEVVQ